MTGEKIVIFGAALLFGFSVYAVADKTDPGKGGLEEKILDQEIARQRTLLDLMERNAEPEEVRRRMELWEEENKEATLEIDQLRAEEHRVVTQQDLLAGIPELIPVFDGEYPEEFLNASEEYLHQAKAFIRASHLSDPEQMRSAIDAFMEEPWHQKLEGDRGLAHEMVMRAEEAQRLAEPELPLSAVEIAELPEEEQIAERIFTLRFEAMQEPLKQGEEVRDRMFSIEPLIEIELKKYQILRENTKIERSRIWIKQLEERRKQK